MISRMHVLEALLFVGLLPSLGLAYQYEPVCIHSAVPAGPGQLVHSPRGNSVSVEPKNVSRRLAPGDGFPQAVVKEFTQTSDGTIWMATELGLYSYDGYQVRHFDTGLLQNAACVRTIVSDGREEIWLGTKAGLAMLEIGKQRIAYPDRFRGVDVLCIGVDHLGRPLVGTPDGLFVYTHEDFLKVEAPTSKSGVRSIETDLNHGTTWIGTDQGLCTLQGLKLQAESLPKLDESPVCKLHTDRFGALWVGTDSSVFRVKSGNTVQVHSQTRRALDYVRNFAESPSGLKISLSSQAVIIDSEQLQADSPKREFQSPARSAHSNFSDRDGNLWSGFSIHPHIVFTRTNLQNFANRRCQNIFREPHSDAIWFSHPPARRPAELVRMQNGELKVWEIRARVSDVAWQKKRILIGTPNGVFQLNGDEVVRHASPDLNTNIFDMATGPDGTLWLATDKGVYSIDEDKVTKHDFGDDFGLVIRVSPWKNGLTLATTAKIRHYDDQNDLLHEVDFMQGIASRQILELVRDDEGRLWIGSTCGLFCQERIGESLSLVGGQNQFLGLFITKAENGRLWAGSYSGPCQIDLETKVIQRPHPEDFGGTHMISDCLVDGDFIWFAGDNGLFRYQDITSVPKLIVDQITSDREHELDAPVRATTDNKLLSVSFHAITPGQRNGSTLYRYRLLKNSKQGSERASEQGPDKGSEQWSETRRNEVELRDLPFGDYSLELQAFDINLAASKIVTVPIAVSVPAMRYAAFALLWISLLCILFSVGYVVRYQQKKNRIMAAQVSAAVSEQLKLEEGLRQAQKLESLGTLASGMAHDFNNMLQVVSACSEVAKDVEDHEQVLESIAMIQDAASQAQGLTRSMLTMGGNQPRQSEVVDLDDLTSNCLAMIRKTFPQSIEIDHQRHSEEPIMVECDPEQITQVLVNACLNARDAMPSGGMISVSIQSIARDSESLARVEVRDTGSGIASENMDRIFEPFFTTKSRGKGTGLGLAVAQGIMGGHNGSINVESTEGNGTCFTLLLPRTTTQSKPIATPQKEPAIDLGITAVSRKKALVAEDQEPVRKVLVHMLEESNFDVVTADNGAKALELAWKTRPDVLVLDVDMPLLDGLTVLGKIRTLGYDTPAVIVTGGPVRAPLPPNTVVLLKPFTSQQLQEAATGQAI